MGAASQDGSGAFVVHLLPWPQGCYLSFESTLPYIKVDIEDISRAQSTTSHILIMFRIVVSRYDQERNLMIHA